MASAATAASVAAYATIAGVGISTYSAFQSAAQQNAANRAQAKQLEYQSKLEEANAREQAALLEQEGTRTRAAQVAAAAKAGFDVESESRLIVLADTAKKYEQDAEAIRRGGALAASASRYNAAAYRGATNTWTPYLSAGSSLFSGAGSVYNYGSKAGWFD